MEQGGLEVRRWTEQDAEELNRKVEKRAITSELQHAVIESDRHTIEKEAFESNPPWRPFLSFFADNTGVI